MKKLLAVSAVLVLGLFLASPALAGHHGRYRGHGHRVVRGAVLGVRAFPSPHFRAPRVVSSFSVSLGLPVYYSYPVYYSPAPVYYAPAVVAAPCEPIWVPGHYAWINGFQVYVQGHWSH